MSRIEKEFAKITQSPNNTKWADLKATAERFGCFIEHGGKHWKVYHKLIQRPLTISVLNNGKVKTIYVKKIIKLINQIKDEEAFNND